MLHHHFGKIIDSVVTFSEEPRQNITDWIEVVYLKFDIIGYDSHQKRRLISQYRAGNA